MQVITGIRAFPPKPSCRNATLAPTTDRADVNSSATSMHRFSRLAGAVRHRWVRRTALLLLALFILFGLFGYFAAPGIIKSQAEKALSAALHRKFTIERVEVSP